MDNFEGWRSRWTRCKAKLAAEVPERCNAEDTCEGLNANNSPWEDNENHEMR